MQSFTIETGRVASLPMANIDTDVIMPKQFLKGIDRQGLAGGVFYDLRTSPQLHPDFALNHPALTSPKFLVTGPNFGCGSSREHAVWGMMQFGIRAVIGTSFGGIFADNSDNNGLLLLNCDSESVEALHRLARHVPCEMTVDLNEQQIRVCDHIFPFEISAGRKSMLLAGQDSIARTEGVLNDFEGFEQQYFQKSPWLMTE